MDPSLRLLLVSSFFVCSAYADLQLAPKASEAWVDGAKIKFLAFSDGTGKDVTYDPPAGWEYSGTAAQLTLRPPNRAQAEATITRVPLSQPGSFDDESLKQIVIDVVAQLPKGSENINVVSQEKNPLLIQRKETFLVTINYTFYGQKFGRSILFLNRGTEQIRAQLTCHQSDFKDLEATFLRSHVHLGTSLIEGVRGRQRRGQALRAVGPVNESCGAS